MAAEIQAYFSKRDALIQEDRSLRRENKLLHSLTENESVADKIVRRIRAEEEASIWSVEHDEFPHLFPGMEFLTSKSIIDKTRIFKIVSKMPKGALLHAHLDATVDKTYLLELALKEPLLHVRTPGVVTTTNLTATQPEFRAFKKGQSSQGISVTDTEYQANGWIPLHQAREFFAYGGAEGFDKWVLGAVSINPAEAYGTHNTVTKIWQKFLSTFRATAGLFLYRPIFRQYIYRFLLESIDDGISYMEPRINFFHKYMFDAEGEQTVPHREWLLDFEQAIREARKTLKEQDREEEFIGAKIIYTTVRIISPEDIEWYLEDCIGLKKEFPDLIAGFDIVGDENVARPLTDYIKPLLKFKQRVKDLGLELPLILHAGETLSDGGKADNNLYDALLLGTKRIGHGFSIVKHPKLMQLCRENGIALEVCPISNEILRLSSSMPMHPLPVVLNQGVPVTLNSDDPSVFGAMGLSYDFFQVLVSSETTGLITLGQMARDSIEFSTLEKTEKRRALSLWEKRWYKFVDNLVSSGSGSVIAAANEE
ncbi:adenosine deaminase-like growth [Multifurca ochricompacta]|uniref:adenosine deaminase n=1 Tax=Multifurca ochricompacta TaxID=376703 RepID=A0AAD4MA87_9AGAM|nr:adenosine deaminase-like growth [Multifurca ochricompacta]